MCAIHGKYPSSITRKIEGQTKMAKRALPSRTGVPHIRPHLCITHAPYTSNMLPMALTYTYSLVINFNSRVGP
jgi:hypothetical protein